MSSILNGLPNHIQRFKPAIGRGFISHLSPHPFLDIKPRLVRRKILQVNPLMCPDEIPNFFPFVPLGAINIQPDRIVPKPAIQLAEASKEAFSVALGTPQHPHPTQQGGNPAKNIQPVMMLTGSRNPQPSANLTPSSAQTRMQCKTGLIFKDNGFFSPQSPQFFLTCDETFGLPRSAPADTYIRPSSSDNPVGASMIALAAPSDGFQIDFSDGPPRSDRPSERDLDQTLQATSLNVLPVSDKLAGSTEPVARVSLQVSGIPGLSHLPCASTDSSFDVSNQALRRPIPDVDPPMSTEEPQSLFRPWLPEFPELPAINRLDLLRDAPLSNWDFA